MQLTTANPGTLPYITSLYNEAFPAQERKPWWLIKRLCKRHCAEVLAIEEDGFAGLAIVLFNRDLALIDYFAIDGKMRGGGIGARALEQLRKRYREKRVLLEIEKIDERAQNNAQRVRRKAFYLRNGFQDADMTVRLFGMPMELMTADCTVSFEEYRSIYRRAVGILSHLAIRDTAREK